MNLPTNKNLLGYNTLGFNYGFLLTKTPEEVLGELKLEIDKLLDNFNLGIKFNNALAGEIQHEFKMSPTPFLKKYIRNVSKELDDKSQYIKYNFPTTRTLEFSTVWINFQQKGEYNPLHHHGGIFSFVIWYQVPYTFEEERRYSYKVSNQDCLNGRFNFVIPHSFSNTINVSNIDLGIDKSQEGYMAIFPSSLSHIVYPFYSSDDYRITISGNILPVNA